MMGTGDPRDLRKTDSNPFCLEGPMIFRANVDCSGMEICYASCAVNSPLGDTKNDGVFCGGSPFPNTSCRVNICYMITGDFWKT